MHEANYLAMMTGASSPIIPLQSAVWEVHAACPNLDAPVSFPDGVSYSNLLQITTVARRQQANHASICYTPHHIWTLPRYETGGRRQQMMITLRCDGTQ